MAGTNTARGGRLLVVGLVVALACGLGATGAAVGSEHATVSIGDAEVGVGEEVTVTVAMTAVPDGLSGFDANLTADGAAVEFTDASIADQLDLADAGVSEDGSTASIKAADTKKVVQPGHGSVDIATVTVSGVSDGTVEISVETDAKFDDDDGTAIDPAIESGTVSVGDGGDGAVSGDSGEGTGNGDSGGLPLGLIVGGIAAVVVIGGAAVFVMKD